jgi:hypothetical protein
VTDTPRPVIIMLTDDQLAAEIAAMTGSACCTTLTCKRRIEAADYCRRLYAEDARRRLEGAQGA